MPDMSTGVPEVVHSADILDVLCRDHASCTSRARVVAADYVIDAVASAESCAASAARECAAAGHVAPATALAPATNAPYVLILLNQPLDAFFMQLWTNATYRICADGAANRLYRHFKNDSERRSHLPHAMIGDLDSVRPRVLRFYRDACDARVYVRREADQDSTDLGKCIQFVRARLQEAARGESKITPDTTVAAAAAGDKAPIRAASPAPERMGDGVEEWNVSSALSAHMSHLFPLLASSSSSSSATSLAPLLIYPAFGGRLDQQMAHLHIAYQYALADEAEDVGASTPGSAHASDASPRTPPAHHPMLLIAEGNSARILLPNRRHRIRAHPCLEAAGHHCGVWPLANDASAVTMTGFRWNLHQAPMAWSGLISTCNLIGEATTADADQHAGEVTVESDVAMVYHTELQHAHVFERVDDDDDDEEDESDESEAQQNASGQ